MAKTNERAQKILAWREAMAAQPDEFFFELVRIYLGELKSPFNKQKLIEELGAFIRRDDIKKQIVALLTDEDISILSAIYFIKEPTQEKLTDFFAQEYERTEIARHLNNLEERLILYRKEHTVKAVFLFNPHLEEEIRPFLSMATLTGEAECAQTVSARQKELSSITIGALLAFIQDNPDLCKGDGTLKKRAATSIEEVFGSTDGIEFLLKALTNLSILKQDDGELSCDYNRLSAFAQLTKSNQLAYICTAGCGQFMRGNLLSQAQLLLDTLASIPPTGMTRSNILRISILLRSHDDTSALTGSRFSRLLQSTQTAQAPAEINIMEPLLDAAVTFGMITQSGATEQGETIFVNALAENAEEAPSEQKISIDAGYTITVMPSITLQELVPLIKFLQIQKCDTVAVFEANRKSVLRGFDMNCTPQTIFETLAAYTPYPLPQTLTVTIEEWYKAYNSVNLYKGYVLQITSAGAIYSEKNPRLARYIKATLAPGIFLMNFANDNEARYVLSRCGMDAVGTIKTVQREQMYSSFATLRPGKVFALQDESLEQKEGFVRAAKEKQDEFIKNLRSLVEQKKMTKVIAEGLFDRIERRLVVDAAQLRPESVRMELTEAFGMDYAGKIHLIEQAIAQNSLVELKYDKSDGTALQILGTPLSLDRQSHDTWVKVQMLPDKDVQEFSIGQALKIRRVRR